jgi:hypothetical protein
VTRPSILSVLWLKQGASVDDAVALLEQNATSIGLGEIFYGPSLAADPRFAAETVSDAVTTMQVAPTIVEASGLDPAALDAVRAEHTVPLPAVIRELNR